MDVDGARYSRGVISLSRAHFSSIGSCHHIFVDNIEYWAMQMKLLAQVM